MVQVRIKRSVAKFGYRPLLVVDVATESDDRSMDCVLGLLEAVNTMNGKNTDIPLDKL